MSRSPFKSPLIDGSRLSLDSAFFVCYTVYPSRNDGNIISNAQAVSDLISSSSQMASHGTYSLP
jgi:hypothetical protein